MCVHVRLSQQRQATIIIPRLCIAVTVTVTLKAKHQRLWFISTGNLYQLHTNNMIGNMTHHINGGESVPVVHYIMCRKEIIGNINVLYMCKTLKKWQRMQSQILQSESGRIKQRFRNKQVNCMCTVHGCKEVNVPKDMFQYTEVKLYVNNSNCSAARAKDRSWAD